MTESCNCESCKLSRKSHKIIKNGSIEEKNLFISELLDLYFHVSADLNYEQAVSDGSWPTAIEIMETRLKFAVDKRNQINMLKKLEE
jgi:hypothetical protein